MVVKGSGRELVVLVYVERRKANNGRKSSWLLHGASAVGCGSAQASFEASPQEEVPAVRGESTL